MEAHDYTDKYCIIGAGPSGITAAKNLKQQGIAFDLFEREDCVGGNWVFGKPNSGVYKSTHLISSKPMTAYTDYPMPDAYPDYPHHSQVAEYIQSYADHFGITPQITFNTSVEQCERDDDGHWLITLDNGETRRYAGLVICNGHLWDPRYPQYDGHFSGESIHTKEYKTPDVLRGKRVLVIGAGNSGCDLVVEAVHHAQKVYHSTRRGYYYIPKYILGKPVDQIDQISRKLRIPKFIRRFNNLLMIRLVLGDPTSYGLPKPDHKLLETHPIANSQMLYHVGHGDVIPKPDVSTLDGQTVHFSDGSSEEIDLIIYATGYRISFPFMNDTDMNMTQDGPALYLHAFHPTYDNLFVVGLLQPDSGIFWLMDMQAQLIARYIHAQTANPAKAATFKRMKSGTQPDLRGGTKHVNSPRHFLEIDHYVYKNQINKHISRL